MTDFKKSAMQKFDESNELTEAWWDSSPLIFKTWEKEMIEKASEPGDKLFPLPSTALKKTGKFPG